MSSPVITAQEGGAVSIQCHYSKDLTLSTKQWCREGEWDKFILGVDHTREGFTLNMKGLEMKDTGRYWCAIKKGEATIGTVMQLKVTAVRLLWVSSSVITAQEGGAVSIQCHYAAHLIHHVKYWCRGDEWSSCENLVQSGLCTPGDKRILNDDKTRAVFTVSVSRLDRADTGRYWCAAENNQVKLGSPVELRVEGEY
uniref:Ig-like domain-containing protein n=1 Tax=Erpetoichthys calabaricus TaxID=27687 RepID=A0A8C4SHD2_ERPCA